MLKLINRTESWIRPLASVTSFVGAISLMLMMFIMVVDVIGRYFFNKPLVGSYELICYTMVLTVFLGLAYAQLENSHVRADIVLHYLKPKAVAVLDVITLSISFITFAYLTWAAILQTKDVYAMNACSEILYIPQWPFQLVVVIGSAVYCLTVIVGILKSLGQISGELDSNRKVI